MRVAISVFKLVDIIAKVVLKLDSAINARVISLAKLVPRVIRAMISLLRLAVKEAISEVRFNARVFKLVVKATSAACRAFISVFNAAIVENWVLASVRVINDAVMLRMVAWRAT